MTARESGRRLDTVVDGEIKASTFAVTPAGSGSSDAKADGKADGKRESVALVDAGGRKTGPPRHSDAWVEAVATEEYHYSLATAAHVNGQFSLRCCHLCCSPHWFPSFLVAYREGWRDLGDGLRARAVPLAAPLLRHRHGRLRQVSSFVNDAARFVLSWLVLSCACVQGVELCSV